MPKLKKNVRKNGKIAEFYPVGRDSIIIRPTKILNDINYQIERVD